MSPTKTLYRKIDKTTNNLHEYKDIKSLDKGYVDFINTILYKIRSGKQVKVYFVDQLREILRFEPGVNIICDNSVFRVSLDAANMRHFPIDIKK